MTFNGMRTQSTHPCFVFEQPVPLVRQKIGGDLFPHQTHALTPSTVIQMFAQHSPECQQAGNTTPIRDAVAEELRRHFRNDAHVVCLLHVDTRNHTCENHMLVDIDHKWSCLSHKRVAVRGIKWRNLPGQVRL